MTLPEVVEWLDERQSRHDIYVELPGWTPEAKLWTWFHDTGWYRKDIARVLGVSIPTVARKRKRYKKTAPHP